MQPQQQYHQVALDMLERPLHHDPFNQYFIDKCEAAYGFAFPASVKEWYLYREATDILEEHSNEDQPLELADIFAASYHRQQYQWWTLPTLAFIPIMVEREFGSLWCLALDGTDDPPVVNWEYPGQWVTCAESFSAFISQQIYDWFRSNGEYRVSCSVDRREFRLQPILKHLAADPLVSVRRYPSGVAHVRTETSHTMFWERRSTIEIWACAPTVGDLRQAVARLEPQVPITMPRWPIRWTR
jgi:SMI1 / KNR4 family (SUKH-1)